jgi:hypothetical protein
VNLLNRFSGGQTILVRFRLFSDPSANRWGWAVDNLEIQDRITGVERPVGVPSVFALSQNYPNPFNPSTTINYDIPFASRVIMTLFDVTGRRVRTLVDASMQAGYHAATWDGRNDGGDPVATGVYIYRIEARPVTGGAREFVNVRKMLLLK